MKFAAHLDTLWSDLPYLDRFEAAEQAGFSGVEVASPYDSPAKDTDRALMRTGLAMVGIAVPPPNYTGGVRGFAAVPESEARFAYDLRRALRYCAALRVPRLVLQCGSAKGQVARDTLIRNLHMAAGQVPQGVMLALHPVNAQETPGAYLDSYDLAAEIVQEVAQPNVGLQLDSYEAQMIHGDAVAVFAQHHAMICHVQVADVPGRGAPGSGGVDFAQLFSQMKTSGYEGWVTAAYVAQAKDKSGFDWMRR